MPSIANPTFYERAEGVAPGRADDFLRTITTDDAEAFCGETESPLGHIMLVKVTRRMISSYVTEHGDPWMSERRNFAPGWYIVREDDNGLIWGMSYGGWCDQHEDFCTDTWAEESARADFAEAQAVDAAWMNAEDGIY